LLPLLLFVEPLRLAVLPELPVLPLPPDVAEPLPDVADPLPVEPLLLPPALLLLPLMLPDAPDMP